MACYHPIPAYQDRPGAEVVLWPTPIGSHSMKLPCGKCLGCRTDHATDWAHRAQAEAALWDHNCFVTLTYDDEHLPENGHLRPTHLQKFLKRLRRGLDRQEPAIASSPLGSIRYLASGEYGERTKRPHFHILLFNCDFRDKKKVANNLWESDTLKKHWKLGGHRIGELTGASANYVAQYSLKKLVTPVEEIVEDANGTHHIPRHDENGEVYTPPFIRMSLKPPIGKLWTEKYKQDLQHGYLVTPDARKKRIPRAMRKQLQQIDPQIAELATINAQAHKRTHNDLRASEAIHQSKNALFHARPL